MHSQILQRLTAGAVGASLLLASAAAPYHASAQSPTPTPTAATGPVVLVGSGEPGYSVNQFGPKTLTVAQGATVTFRGNWLEPHTVTFAGTEPMPTPEDPRAPMQTAAGVNSYDGTKFTNSGFLIQGAPAGAPVFSAFQVAFTKTGTFPFLCIIHPGMSGTVTVVAASAPEISTQAALDTAARTAFATDLTALKAEATRLNGKPLTQTRNADGTSTWGIVAVGGQANPPSDIMQFLPAALNVQVGDTVTWQNSVQAPHTVTFLGGTQLGPPIMDLGDPRMRPTQAPAAGYDGTGLVSSGLNGVGFGPNPAFSVKFTKAGTFAYICILHVDQGMGGTVTVSAATQAATPATPAAPAPPKTGSSGESTLATSMWLVAALALLALAAPFGARAASKRTR